MLMRLPHNNPGKLLPLLLLLAAGAAHAAVVLPPLPPSQTAAPGAAARATPSPMAMVLTPNPAALASTAPSSSVTVLDRPIMALPAAPHTAALTTVKKPVSHKRVARIRLEDPAPVAKGAKPDPYANVTLTNVSESELNRFVFATPVKQLLFPASVPASKPLYVSGNREVLVGFGPGMPRVAQMVAELSNGKIATFYLHTQAGPGAVVRYEGARGGVPAAPAVHDGAASSGSPGAQVIPLLGAVARGEIPPGFEVIGTPAVVAFDKFTVVPVSAWSDNDSTNIYVFQLIAAKGQSAAVSAPEFYRQGVLAVDVEGDTVDDTHSPFVYVVEASHGGE